MAVEWPDRAMRSPNPAQDTPLRVAVVSSSYNYIKDGIALTMNRLVSFLEAQGVVVLVFAPVARTPAFEHSGEVVPVPSVAIPIRPEYRMAFGLVGEARRRLKAFKPDIIHITVPDLLGLQALRLGRALGVPVVSSFHTRYETYLNYYAGLGLLALPYRYYERFFYRSCRSVYVPSESMIDVLAARGIAGNVSLWSRGVDAERFNPSRSSSSWRQRYQIGRDEFVVLFVSRLVREKDLATLGAVFNSLGDERKVRCVVVGDGPDRAMIEARSPKAIFTGFLEGDQLAEAYASSDLFVFPSFTETFGNVTLEAMASGLPVVCADATGNRSLVVNGETGFLVPAGDIGEFLSRIRQLRGDAALRRQFGDAARARSLKYSWDQAMLRMLLSYLQLANRSKQ